MFEQLFFLLLLLLTKNGFCFLSPSENLSSSILRVKVNFAEKRNCFPLLSANRGSKKNQYAQKNRRLDRWCNSFSGSVYLFPHEEWSIHKRERERERVECTKKASSKNPFLPPPSFSLSLSPRAQNRASRQDVCRAQSVCVSPTYTQIHQSPPPPPPPPELGKQKTSSLFFHLAYNSKPLLLLLKELL